MNDVDHISLFDIKFTEGEEFEGKCIFQNQECFYSCVNYDFSYSDPGDEMGSQNRCLCWYIDLIKG